LATIWDFGDKTALSLKIAMLIIGWAKFPIDLRFSIRHSSHRFLRCPPCHNPSLRLTTKARACKVAGQEGSPGVTSHAPKSVKECEGMNPHAPKSAKECEGMNPHIPKLTPILGVGIPMDSRIFRR